MRHKAWRSLRLSRLWWLWLLGSVVWAGAAQAQAACEGVWPAWSAYKQQFISSDGRVIDPFGPRKVTTSEGQAYSLFFALVAGDRPAFDLTLKWTQDNLAAGDLKARLPAWQWGQRDDGSWNVLDANAASDADLWMAYTLGQAARLWNEPSYRELAMALADRVLDEETVELEGLGRVLLPGPVGFGPWTHAGITRVKVNPSYLPIPVLRWLASGEAGYAEPWRAVLDSSLRTLSEGAPQGLAADWLLGQASSPTAAAAWSVDEAFDPDGAAAALPQTDDGMGSYNAIRVYLWLGLTDAKDPARDALVRRYRTMAELTERLGAPPEMVDAAGGKHQGSGPPGFSAALVPYLDAMGRADLVQAQMQRLATDPLRSDAYYEQSLALFSLGHRHGLYRFDAAGQLQPRWTSCVAATASSR